MKGTRVKEAMEVEEPQAELSITDPRDLSALAVNFFPIFLCLFFCSTDFNQVV